MPVKLPKVFPRRKSSSNALEDVDPPSDAAPTESFRLIPRDEAARLAAERKQAAAEKPKFGRLSGTPRPFTSPSQKARQQSFDEESGASNRVYDTSSMSARFSSTSTLPSSAEAEPADNMFSHAHKQSQPLPPPPPHSSSSHTFSIREAAARTFTFSKNHKTAEPASDPHLASAESGEPHSPNDMVNGNRSRALTTSSYASTAMPPRVEADLHLGASDFGSSFDDMFSNYNNNKRRSTIVDVAAISAMRSESEPVLSAPEKSLTTPHRSYQPEPLQIDRSLRVEPSPTSWDSRDSGDRLIMASPTTEEPSRPPPVPPHTYLTAPTPTADRHTSPRVISRGNLRSSSSFEDEDAKLVRQSLVSRSNYLEANTVQRKPISTSSSSDTSMQTPMSSRSASNNTTPRAPGHAHVDDEESDSLFDLKKTNKVDSAQAASPNASADDDENRPLFDHTTIAAANAARKFTESAPARRVMREDQFRKQKQLSAAHPPVDESDSDSSADDYDDEDEAKAIAQQQELRRKQERQLQMNREIMRKTTAGGDPNRPGSQADTQSMNDSGYPPEMFINRPDDWEDEDIPLGILKEHGFPSHIRPPTKPADAAPSFIRSQSGLPDRPASAGALGGGVSRASLPAFARNLPVDPYFGASLVRPSNRESLAFGGNNSMFGPQNMGQGSVYGGSGAAPNVPTGGLIAVIQEEERAKKVRRASPGSTYGYGSTFHQNQLMPQMPMAMPQRQSQFLPMQMQQMQQQQQQQQQQMWMMGMMQQPYGGQMNSPEFAAAVAKEMLMQTQMQIQQMQMGGGMQNPQVGGMQGMQQMSPQMGGMPPGMQQQQQMGMPPYQQASGGFLSPNVAAQNGMMQQRPMSMASNSAPMPGQQQRAMSMLAPPPRWGAPQPTISNYSPSIYNLNPLSASQGGYAPSLAPSERSNVGMASRYRPVANQPLDGTSSVSSVTMLASGGAPAETKAPEKEKSTIKGILKKGVGAGQGQAKQRAEEAQPQDEEDSWAKTIKARKNKWAAKKEVPAEPQLKDLYFEGV